MDGVLVDSEDLIAAAVQRMYREWYGVEVPQSAFKPYIGAGEDMFRFQELTFISSSRPAFDQK